MWALGGCRQIFELFLASFWPSFLPFTFTSTSAYPHSRIAHRNLCRLEDMSRLIVKNLPVYLTQDRLRKHFEGSDGPGGALTDVKLVFNADGTSRRFGFIGYKTPAEAERARNWFNRTYVDSSRIAVDIVDVSNAFSVAVSIDLCQPVGSARCPSASPKQTAPPRSVARRGCCRGVLLKGGQARC